MAQGAPTVSESSQRPSRRLPALYVAVASSRRLAGILAGLHGAAMAALMVASIPMPVNVIAIGAILWAGIRGIRRQALRMGAEGCVALRLRHAGRCEIIRRDGSCLDGEIHGGTGVLPQLIILRVSQREKRRIQTVVLLPDAVSPEAMRRLRVRLRWSGDAKRQASAQDVSL